MLNYIQILILAIIQGACELLPVSSSAHVIATEKLMGLNPSAPELTLLLVMLHTGTMFAVIVYFWNAWRRDYFQSRGQTQWFVIQLLIASFCTAVVYEVVKTVIRKVFLHGGDIEELFGNLQLIAVALAVVGVLIIFAGWRGEKRGPDKEIQPSHSVWIGIVQGFCIPFRGFSRSGSTISTGLLLGLPKKKLEEFSFALAVVLTPAAIAQELHRLLKEHAFNGQTSLAHLLVPDVVGMIFSFAAGLLALKWLSRWLEGGRWSWFGYYCLAAAVGVLLIHSKFPN
ncbi:MAG TPA: undecaprenyl-diphosphate phosphatase [Verrucomicrobiae bacterium]|jgi:undecaprenyl-diphosphatase